MFSVGFTIALARIGILGFNKSMARNLLVVFIVVMARRSAVGCTHLMARKKLLGFMTRVARTFFMGFTPALAFHLFIKKALSAMKVWIGLLKWGAAEQPGRLSFRKEGNSPIFLIFFSIAQSSAKRLTLHTQLY